MVAGLPFMMAGLPFMVCIGGAWHAGNTGLTCRCIGDAWHVGCIGGAWHAGLTGCAWRAGCIGGAWHAGGKSGADASGTCPFLQFLSCGTRPGSVRGRFSLGVLEEPGSPADPPPRRNFSSRGGRPPPLQY
eukprot:gene10674-biopygen9354